MARWRGRGRGVAESLGVLRQLDDSGVVIDDFQLRRPTLDDVFLTLTGQAPAEDEAEPQSTGRRSGAGGSS